MRVKPYLSGLLQVRFTSTPAHRRWISTWMEDRRVSTFESTPKSWIHRDEHESLNAKTSNFMYLNIDIVPYHNYMYCSLHILSSSWINGQVKSTLVPPKHSVQISIKPCLHIRISHQRKELRSVLICGLIIRLAGSVVISLFSCLFVCLSVRLPRPTAHAHLTLLLEIKMVESTCTWKEWKLVKYLLLCS